jgi:hypothetical protein
VPGRLVRALAAPRAELALATGGHWPVRLVGTHTGSPQQLLTTQVWPVGHVLLGPHVVNVEQSAVPGMQIPPPLALDAQTQSMLEEHGVGNPASQVSPTHPCGEPAA